MTEPGTQKSEAIEQRPEDEIEPRLVKERLADLDAIDGDSVKGGETAPEHCEGPTM